MKLTDNKTFLIDIEEDAGVNRDSLDYQATYGDLPDLLDDHNNKKGGPSKHDPGAFQQDWGFVSYKLLPIEKESTPNRAPG